MNLNQNNSTSQTTQTNEVMPPKRFIIIAIVFFIGIVGNFLALLILAKKRNSKNSKYTLMLRCLATNNLIGLLGMLTQATLKICISKDILNMYVRWNCIGMVVWRFFGLSSGCIAAVMAIERWMALARPFTYHKHITYNVVRKTINILLLIATIVTFLPLFGFGVYYNEEKKQCARYRDGTTLTDISYAYLFMVFGMLLCTVIVVCNLFVARVLYFIGRNKTNMKSIRYDIVNREKGQENSPPTLYHTNSMSGTPSTSDEIKFAKLMAFLSISFVICWMPQMISIVLKLQFNLKAEWFYRIADILIALHFTSDPYIYVLSRTKQSFILSCIKRWRQGLQRSQSDQSRLRPTIEQTIEYRINT